MRWAGHVAHIEDMRDYIKWSMEKLKERGHLGDLGVDGIILKRTECEDVD
jgi:hypothetical protein